MRLAPPLHISNLLNDVQAELSVPHISQSAKLIFTPHMDVRAIRQANLELLLDEHGGPAKLAEKVGISAPYITQIRSKTTKRQMGDNVARRIETALDLPHGWMDHNHGVHAKEPASEYRVGKNTKELVEKVSKLSAEERDHLIGIVDAMARRRRR